MDQEQPHAEILRHMKTHYGHVQELALVEIVPGDVPITIHVIPATPERQWTTLFTAGMSDAPMNVPEGYEAYRYAELLIHLPPEWPLTPESLQDPDHFWPIQRLREIAYYPHRNDTWFGPRPTIISNGEPPEPYASNTRLSCMMLMRETSEEGELETSDGRSILFYWLLPLYAEERDLEMEKGLEPLFALLDEFEVPLVVDIDRANVTRNRL